MNAHWPMLSPLLLLALAAPAFAAPPPVETAHYAFQLPQGYSQRADAAGELAFVRPAGGGDERLYVQEHAPDPEAEAPMSAEALYEAEKATYADGELGVVRADERTTLGGAPAYMLEITYQSAEESDYQAVVIAEHAGRVVEIGWAYPASKPPAAARSELAHVLESWRWKAPGPASGD